MTTAKRDPFSDLAGSWWEFLLKMALATYPPTLISLMMWGAWVTGCIFTLQPNVPRYTAESARADNVEIMRQIDARFSELPPNDWRVRIVKLEEDVRAIREGQIQILTELKKQMH